MNYYDEIIEKIEDSVANNKWDLATYLINDELNMPYLPQDFEIKLRELQKKVNYNKKILIKNISDEELLFMLDDSSQQQILAVSSLVKKNLRDYLDVISKFIEEEHDKYAKAYLLAALIEQEIDEYFIINKDGLQYEFNPSIMEYPTSTAEFNCGWRLLHKWLEKFPAQLELAKTIYIKENYMFLPLLFEEDDAILYAKSIAYYVIKLMDSEKEANRFLTKWDLSAKILIDINDN